MILQHKMAFGVFDISRSYESDIAINKSLQYWTFELKLPDVLTMPRSSKSVTHTRSTVLTIDSKRSSSKAETSDTVSTVTSGFRLSILDLAASSFCTSKPRTGKLPSRTPL